MKEVYLRPTVVGADILEAHGIFPLAAIGAAVMSAGAAAGGALAAGAAAATGAASAVAATEGVQLAAGYAIGRSVKKSVAAMPAFRLPSLVKRGGADDGVSMA
ncbi:MAG: hypothetical protein IJ668_06400 [Selenomonadaceae bacterium]|nr:hypothetical protein [Selenomonadaceae bacterium]MBR1580111.1 hypothetical protein [Selenomonadaceae bacterium]